MKFISKRYENYFHFEPTINPIVDQISYQLTKNIFFTKLLKFEKVSKTNKNINKLIDPLKNTQTKIKQTRI